jgi:hypothetical protein
MASSARIFFAGVGTTFAILAIGFGGGLILAKSAIHDQPAQVRASSESRAGTRVILPTSAEPALQVTAAVQALPQSQPQQQVQPQAQLQPVVAVTEPPVDKGDAKKAERDAKAERKRQAERKARRLAERVRRGGEPQLREPNIMAFGVDESRTNLFGN